MSKAEAMNVEAIAADNLSTSMEPSASVADIDPLSVERTWDHSNRKVIVYNINKYIMNKDLHKLQIEWWKKLEDPTSININKWKKSPNGNWVLVTLETEEMVEPFMNLINSNRFQNKKGQILYAKTSNSKLEQELEGNRNDDSKDTKRKSNDGTDENKNNESKRQKPEGPLTNDDVRDKLTPLWKLSYEDQLKHKKIELIKRSCMKLVQEVKVKFRSLEKEAKRNKNRKPVKVYDWLQQKRAIEVEEIIPSPLTQEYRNKSEMTFGYRHESETSKVPAVGFMAAGWSGGVSKPHMLQNVPWEICAIADVVDEFLATSKIPPYDSRIHRGLWRTLTIRSSKRTGEVMLVIIHAPSTGGAGTDEKEDYSHIFAIERERFVAMLTDKDLSPPERTFPDGSFPLAPETMLPLKVTSIFFQDYDGLSNPKPDHPVQHVYGKTSISEQLGECTFEISPGAFFQVNTECAELLYKQVVNKVRQVCPDPDNTILFDVCCGTGTIGMTCMKAGVASTVIGVDISEPAIVNAKLNAKLNGFSQGQTRFVANRAELIMSQELNKVKHLKKTIVAVVDPAREGLHGDVIRALRGHEQIQRLIYVSCNPTGSLIKDTGLLCAPATKKYPGKAFRPTSAQPVDMFPMTTHCELVLTFDRLTDEEAGVLTEDINTEASLESGTVVPTKPMEISDTITTDGNLPEAEHCEGKLE